MMTSRYGRREVPDWELICQVGEYDVYENRSGESRWMLFVWGVHGVQHKMLAVKEVLDYFRSVPYVCAWFRMAGYAET